MVSLTDIQASNAQIASALPTGLVAVFVGATSGIGEYALKHFTKYARGPRIYFVGRSQEAGDRITAECKALNAQGEFIFIKADVSLMKAVDDVCRDIKSKETAINLLFLTQGSLDSGYQTPDDLPISLALPYYSRLRFTLDLLPLLQKGQALRRVVSVFAATKEGEVDTSNLHVKGVPLMSQRGHISSMVTLALEELARRAPEVSFIHDYPGFVKTGIGRQYKGAAKLLLQASSAMLGPLIFVPEDESGARHVYLATSAKYPSKSGLAGGSGSGVPLGKNTQVGRGTDGEVGSGVYSVGNNNETAGVKVLKILEKLRYEGVDTKAWEHTMKELKRITGAEAL